ncbi:uncharacterized protein [Dermacentor albipictus]|uniref:uncharacterized protein n=1 Tax=Dermacentor albipictus TaxID=60249 RepID=UPI0038FC183F
MARMKLLALLLFAASLTMLEATLRFRAGWPLIFLVPRVHRGRKHGGFPRFLTTPEPIWIYNTTGHPERQCEVQQVQHMNKTSVHLIRSYYEHSKKISGDLQGTFDLKHVAHMFIQLPDVPYNQTEDILYMSRRRRCAVIKIRSTLQGSPATYDLRVRNSSITRGPSRGCKRKFRKYARGSHGTYQTKCQEILRNITQLLSTVAANANQQSQRAR